jgi:dihydrofolate reductase
MSSKLTNVEAILAVDAVNGLAKNEQIPWKSKTDLKFFKNKTLENFVVMGSKTLLSLPKSMPLKTELTLL